MNKKLKLAFPAGSYKEATIALFRKAGIKIEIEDRSCFPLVNDGEIECQLLRAQEIGRYVESGKFDIGITGKDWIEESGANIEEIDEFLYTRNGSAFIRLALAVPNDSEIKEVKDLKGKVVATEFVNITKKYLKEKGINAKVEFSWGSTEGKAPYLADAVVDLVDSGKSFRVNNLRIIDTVFTSTTRFIANKESYKDPAKRKQIDALVLRIKKTFSNSLNS
ncbi:MAG: ATP phosphoribosyltransferase [Candidatus Paceibacterota bacterium]|jgi:ATP phosphoribosyltransferase